MPEERRIASSHLVLQALFLGLATVILVAPTLGLMAQWRWLAGEEKVWLVAFTAALYLLAGLLVRFSLRPGIFVSPEGFRIQGVFGSDTMRWDEVGSITPLRFGHRDAWLRLDAGEWGFFSPGAESPKRRMFIQNRSVYVPGDLGARGLRAFVSELLLQVHPEVLGADETVNRWMREQVEGGGPLFAKLI